MQPVSFHPKERIQSPAFDSHPDVIPLKVLDAKYEGGGDIVVSCWKLSDLDLERIKNTGKVYIAFMGDRHPAMMASVNPEDVGI